MTDVLYVVRGDRPCLRHSLRSLAKFASNVGRVVVAGTDLPAWLSDEVVRVEVPSPYDRKQKNILFAILETLRRGAVRKCLYSSDDHFMTAPTNLDVYPVFVRPYGYPPLPPPGANAFHMSIYDTGRMLASFGLPCDLRMDGHWNTWIDAADLGAVESVTRGYERSPWGYEPTTPFVSVARARGALADVVLKDDFKLKANKDAEADFAALAKRGMLSAQSLDRCPRFRAWLEEQFPEPCRWEKA